MHDMEIGEHFAFAERGIWLAFSFHLLHFMTIDQFIERIYNLRVDTTTKDGDGLPHEKPHKPLLLLAALDLIDEGLATPDRIPWNRDLRDRFKALRDRQSELWS
jgi:hypothetical protein